MVRWNASKFFGVSLTENEFIFLMDNTNVALSTSSIVHWKTIHLRPWSENRCNFENASSKVLHWRISKIFLVKDEILSRGWNIGDHLEILKYRSVLGHSRNASSYMNELLSRSFRDIPRFLLWKWIRFLRKIPKGTGWKRKDKRIPSRLLDDLLWIVSRVQWFFFFFYFLRRLIFSVARLVGSNGTHAYEAVVTR